MNLWHPFTGRIRALFQKSKLDAEMAEEIREHIELRTQANIEAGMNPEEARFAAMRQFGGSDAIKEDCRDQRGVIWLENLIQDIHYGARVLRKNIGFTVVAVLTLALGIGATTAIFSIINGVLLKPLPHDQAGQLVHLWEAPSPGGRNWVSPGAFLDWREHSTVFEELSLLDSRTANLTGDSEPEQITGLAMSANGLQILRAQPLIGRTFAPDEDQSGKDKVVVLGEGFWQRRFGGATNLVGRSIVLNDESHIVIGILPDHFIPWGKADYMIPAAVAPQDINQRTGHWLRVFGRLHPGETLARASAEMSAVAARLRPLYPAHKQEWGVTVVAMHQHLTGDTRPTLLVLLGAVGCVLLIACGNVANLLLAKATGRQKEIAVRAALGASRWRVIRQLLAESTLLSLLGAALGLLFALWGMKAIGNMEGVNLPRAQEIGLDWRVLAFTMAVSLMAGIGFGLVPALQATRLNLHDTLKDGTRISSGGRRNRVRSGLIVAEVALSLVLLTGAGLLLNSFIRLSNVSSGINPRNALTMQVTLPDKKYPDAVRRADFYRQTLERITVIPGVEAAGVTGVMPLAGWLYDTTFSIVGREGQPDIGHSSEFDFCSPDYFRAAGIPLRKGRFFDANDRVGAPRVVIINEALAREHFPDQEPLGQRLHMEAFNGKIDEGWEVVGVVGDVHQRGLGVRVRPCVYRPQAFSSNGNNANLVIRTTVPPLAVAESVRKAVLEIDPHQPVANIRTLEDALAASVAPQRVILLLVGAFAAVALLLAAIGLYGVIAYTVSQRTRELGIRMALGARRKDVLRLILRYGLRLALFGVAAGLAGAIALTRLLRNHLYEVGPTDPITFAITAALLVTVALIACLIPARRAARVNPLVALRTE